MPEFKDLSRGEQFVVLLRREYEELVRYATLDIAMMDRSLNEYTYSHTQRMDVEEALRMRNVDLTLYGKALAQLKGAENEESILTVQSTESLSQFAGVNCTTVL